MTFMDMISARVIEDSRAHNGVRLTTLQLVYPRFIHGELMTHRVFSRNAASSRAIPVAKMIEQVRTNPAATLHWGMNQPGMQAHAQLEGDALTNVQYLWRLAADDTADVAERMVECGAHKQVANRLLEPFQWMQTILSSTSFDNWNELRDHEDAEPNIQVLARRIKVALNNSVPILRGFDRTLSANWHLPYVTRAERERHPMGPLYLAKLSTARNARVSYLTHDGEKPDAEKDLALYERLVGGVPLHASPTEHIGTPAVNAETWNGNFRGWRQFRKMVEAHMKSDEPL